MITLMRREGKGVDIDASSCYYFYLSLFLCFVVDGDGDDDVVVVVVGDQGVRHGEGGDQVVGRWVERPLVDHRQDHEEVA